MPTTPNVNYSNAKLTPAYDAELAKERSVNIKASSTIAAGTVLGELMGTNAVQSVTLASATGGTFTLTWGGQTTGAIAYNAAASAVQTAFTALSSVGAGNATVSGSAGGPYTVTFVNALGRAPRATLTASGTSLTGAGASVTPASVTTGVHVAGGTFAAYDSTHTDGTEVAKCLSVYDVVTDSDGNVSLGSVNTLPLNGGGVFGVNAPVYVSGSFKDSDLTGLDATAVAALVMRYENGNIDDGGIVRF